MLNEDREKELQNKIDDLELTLSGVMWFVDKWLDGNDLEKDEITRSMLSREKSLNAVESERRKALKDAVSGFECHSDYHGDAIVSRLVCMAEGKDVSELVKPLPKDYYYKKSYVDLRVEKLLKDIEKHIITNEGIDWEWFDSLTETWNKD